ncbi:MAG TPA: hypothetical protein VGG83_27530 [Trebonia sp.]
MRAIRCCASSMPIVCPAMRSTIAVPTRLPAAMVHGQARPADRAGRIAPTQNAMASARSNEPSSWAACTPAPLSWPRISSGTVMANCATATMTRPARWVRLPRRRAAGGGAAASTRAVRSRSRNAPPSRPCLVTTCARCSQERQSAQSARCASSTSPGMPLSSPSIRAEMASRALSHSMFK